MGIASFLEDEKTAGGAHFFSLPLNLLSLFSFVVRGCCCAFGLVAYLDIDA